MVEFQNVRDAGDDQDLILNLENLPGELYLLLVYGWNANPGHNGWPLYLIHIWEDVCPLPLAKRHGQ